MQRAVGAGIAVPGMMSSLAYFDTYRRGRLPANLVQVRLGPRWVRWVTAYYSSWLATLRAVPGRPAAHAAALGEVGALGDGGLPLMPPSLCAHHSPACRPSATSSAATPTSAPTGRAGSTR